MVTYSKLEGCRASFLAKFRAPNRIPPHFPWGLGILRSRNRWPLDLCISLRRGWPGIWLNPRATHGWLVVCRIPSITWPRVLIGSDEGGSCVVWG